MSTKKQLEAEVTALKAENARLTETIHNLSKALVEKTVQTISWIPPAVAPAPIYPHIQPIQPNWPPIQPFDWGTAAPPGHIPGTIITTGTAPTPTPFIQSNARSSS